MRKRTLQVVEASGRPFELGRKVGRICASKGAAYRKGIAASIKHSTGYDWPKAVEKAEQYLAYAEEFYPDFIEELRGYSEGSRLAFADIFTCCCHELLGESGFRGCTDLVVSGDVTEKGNVIAAHNEDWSEEQADTVVLLHSKPVGKPEFICTAYAGFLPSSGMNSSGISITGNALEPNDVRIGIPKMFPVRKSLEARRIGQAIEWALPLERASSYNNICTDRNGEMYSLEGSATDCAWIYGVDGFLVHTNHYTTPKMLKYESDPSSVTCSIFRFNRTMRLLEKQLGSVSVDSVMGIMRDHVNKPGSICRHASPGVHPLDVSETVFSVLYDLTTLEAYVCKGHPCETEYSRVTLLSD